MIKYKKYKLNKSSRIVLDEFPMWSEPSGKSLDLFWKFFYIYWDKGFFWFRFFGGYGLKGTKQKRFILFSERTGKVKTYKAFGWTFRILKPNKN